MTLKTHVDANHLTAIFFEKKEKKFVKKEMWKCNLFLKKRYTWKIHSQNEGLDLVAILS
jgi:hypothetical protein